ncbi:MAG: FeoB-associated Cys-rich membrane protein [Lachnospiraceae bacterium]|nr:FeoB-associated Cys-rich membrane protein [Lachnospiraceae bacterium]
MAWIAANAGNIIVTAVLVLVVGLVVRGMIRDRLAGRHICGGDCGNCGSACSYPNPEARAAALDKDVKLHEKRFAEFQKKRKKGT